MARRWLRPEGGPNAPRKPGRWRGQKLCDHVTARAEVFGVIQIVRRDLDHAAPVMIVETTCPGLFLALP